VTPRSVGQFLLGLAVLAALIVAGWIGLQYVLALLSAGGKVPDVTQAVLLAGLGAVGYLYRSTRDRERELEERLAEQKRTIYQQYLDIVRRIVEQSGTPKGIRTEPLVVELRKFAFSSVLYASDEVVQAHVRFATMRDEGRPYTLGAIADILVAIRRDIGFPKTKLTREDVLGVFIRDVENLPGMIDGWDRYKAGKLPPASPT
jgi:hypothetical protein